MLPIKPLTYPLHVYHVDRYEELVRRVEERRILEREALRLIREELEAIKAELNQADPPVRLVAVNGRLVD